ncbi:Oidioi.mRNA.OKI2018_I69.PAR.g10490.t1.cds [Oikopleura dioica]|uniref:Oidioi.mRNA.OKI2018_I69.PAR.g10490.t1.cds n=1 Tax=Oikopleura dioica TaxID=34765 RepID=A0ABN7RUV9_OIKDI|nr:Oidioi.mRNA.OKI2018_I69.PAR.g10490.t1.cds [Oikopleura dioica]
MFTLGAEMRELSLPKPDKNDLLYTILLKQQRKPPVSDFEPGHIETTKIKLLKAGSIDRLVDHLGPCSIFT